MKSSDISATKIVVIVFTIILIISTLENCNKKNEPIRVQVAIKPISSSLEEITIPAERSIHLELNTPNDNDSSDDYIISRSQYILSYNKNLNVCNWVSYELNSDWYGDAKRYSGSFISDTVLPLSFYHVKHSDYTNSGYDRGHLVSSEQRTDNDIDNKSTFILTNIIPQTPDLNRGVWYDMEDWCLKMCKDSLKELFICAGGIYRSGKRINQLIAIPDSCFKIVVVLEPGQKLANINNNTRIEAVIMPNTNGIRKDKWQQYKCTVNDIEKATGYNFLNYVRNDVQTVIENR
ncbi:MAG: DNA/RNA non-specific endonuclease [Ignavibacteriae bacterium]|nr:DNA/RNA non-specific endonuclease [Ignavibacteriota bacterium]